MKSGLNNGKMAAGRAGGLGMLILAGALAVACGGPQLKMLSKERLKPLESGDKVEVYIGEIKPPYQEVAIIESDATAYVDNTVKKQQIEQLRTKARRLGANAIQNVHILSKHVKGYTIDERVPFAAWRQGDYELYFMRGVAINVPESEPANLDEARPSEGWAIDKLAPPPRLESKSPAMPALQSEAKPGQSEVKSGNNDAKAGQSEVKTAPEKKS